MQQIINTLLGTTPFEIFIQLFGIIGTLCVAIPFLLGSSMGRKDWAHDTWKFILVNITGAVILTITLCFHFNLGSFLIEIFWITGGLIGISKKLRSRQQADLVQG
ncbi:putative permease [Vibrio phage vB_VcorM_GR11A]|nr:putative permease [Vibrio phage vB_VcorM_GR11A]